MIIGNPQSKCSMISEAGAWGALLWSKKCQGHDFLLACSPCDHYQFSAMAVQRESGLISVAHRACNRAFDPMHNLAYIQIIRKRVETLFDTPAAPLALLPIGVSHRACNRASDPLRYLT